jgi:hypothetical protein
MLEGTNRLTRGGGNQTNNTSNFEYLKFDHWVKLILLYSKYKL